ncbi:MAG TPA: hypothetical protein HPP83_09930 [Candidatus Hydrogenedentes bacterium]|nr:hypothetical protein [Candidatus Hydrogenedentota bacterium]
MPKVNFHVHCGDKERPWRQVIPFPARLRHVIGIPGFSQLIVLLFGWLKALDVSEIMVFTGFVLMLLLGLLVFRRHQLALIETAKAQHALFHDAREKFLQIKKALELRDSTQNEGKLGYQLYLEAQVKAFNDRVANNIADCFSHILGHEGTHCVIRLARIHGGEEVYDTVAHSGHQLYVTAARSFHMDRRRRDVTGPPIKAKEGIAKRLVDKKLMGVEVINNKKAAEKEGIWKMRPSDAFKDAKREIAASICSYLNGTKHMVGMLFITSESRYFTGKHAMYLAGFADFLGILYPEIFQRGLISQEYSGNIELGGDRSVEHG